MRKKLLFCLAGMLGGVFITSVTLEQAAAHGWHKHSHDSQQTSTAPKPKAKLQPAPIFQFTPQNLTRQQPTSAQKPKKIVDYSKHSKMPKRSFQAKRRYSQNREKK